MKRRERGAGTGAAAAVFIILSAGILWAIDWPVSTIVLTGTFGENRDSHFHAGIDLGGGEQSVFPVLAGEMLFYHEEGEDPLDLPTGLGSFVILEHDRGLRSLYSHLKAGSIPAETVSFTTTTSVGTTGDTGSSYGTHLHFAIIDREFNQIVNPLLLLNPIADMKKPVIEKVELVANNQNIPLADNAVLTSGTYSLQVTTYDVSEHVKYFNPMSVFSIDVFHNGEQLYKITHEALQEKGSDVILVQSPSLSFDDYYIDQWTVTPGTITLNPGDSRIEVVVRDYSGNETVRTYTLKAREGE